MKSLTLKIGSLLLFALTFFAGGAAIVSFILSMVAEWQGVDGSLFLFSVIPFGIAWVSALAIKTPDLGSR